MEGAPESVERHYGRGRILDSILRTLRQAGKDLDRLKPADLAPVDEFHIRGREATIELAARAALHPGLRILDVGCGLGGSARYLAAEHGCKVVGIDLTQEYVDTANVLAAMVGLEHRVEFRQASALEIPFDRDSFDIVWTEHVQMNIADKQAFYAEIARVLVPRGRFLFHDVFRGDGGPLWFPVPWAEEGSISFLAPPESVCDILTALGFSVHEWADKSQQSLEWFASMAGRLASTGPPPLGTHLLMGDNAKTKFANNIRNLRERRFVVFQALAEKTPSSVA